MVIEQSNKRWQCPYCSQTYEDYDDAYDCATECVNINSPEEILVSEGFLCEYCNKLFPTESHASDCEEEHKTNEDSYYEKKTYEDGFKMLAEAASHKYQQKIHKFFS